MKEDERRGMHVLRRVFFTKREHMQNSSKLTFEFVICCEGTDRSGALWNGARQFSETKDSVKDVPGEQLLGATGIAQQVSARNNA